MGTLYLVRHGQASFGADDYDVLSAMGHQQSVRLGEYFQHRGVTFDAALTGTLNRQIQTLAGICQGMGVEFAVPDGAERSEGPPQASSAPLGAILRQAQDERNSVSEPGGHPTPAGAAEPALPGRRRSAPEGLEPAAPNLLEQVWTGDRGEASREPRPAQKAMRSEPTEGQSEPRNRLCRAAGGVAPSGGSAVREATSVGAIFTMAGSRPGPGRGVAAPAAKR